MSPTGPTAAAAGAAAPKPSAASATSIAPTAPPAVASASGIPTAVPEGASSPWAPAARKAAGEGRVSLPGVLNDTPGRMNALRWLTIVMSFVFALGGALALYSTANATTRADTNADQVVRIQGIYSDILRADSDATNAFLVAGLENPAQRADYEAAMARVTSAISTAASTQPSDADALALLNGAIQRYAADVESARAYNRQGMPVGSQYLKQASASLRATALPLLDNLRVANADRTTGEFAVARMSLPFHIIGLATLLAFAGVGVWLAKRTHRYLNTGLTAAAAAVLAAYLLATGVLMSASSTLGEAERTTFRETTALASIRSAAFDIRANESLGLIARGQAAPYEARVQARIKEITTAIDLALSPAQSTSIKKAATDYFQAHAAIRSLDDKGAWDQAVSEATTTSQAAGRTFAALDTATATPLADAQAKLSQQTLAPRTSLLIAALAVLVGGIAASGLTARGIAKRLEEYR